MTSFKRQSILAAAASAFALIAANHAFAGEGAERSAFGCGNLEDISELQMIEGKDGMFYRILADMRLQHAFTPEVIDRMAEMAKALEAKGTTLIYVPVPTKSQVLPQYAPQRAELYGFDPSIARAVYDDVVERLNKKGVTTVDIASPMRDKPENQFGELAFFKSDFHWTAQGANAAAEAVGEKIKSLPEYADVTPVKFKREDGPVSSEFSSMRKLLQQHCLDSVPQVKAHTYVVSRDDDAASTGDAGSGLDIFGNEDTGGIALIGTSYSDKTISNFAGLLQYWSGLPVENYSISGGNQFGSILSYITSREFQEQRPRFLIWENPIYNNLGQYGDGPWYEIIAASRGECDQEIKLTPGVANSFHADLSNVSFAPGDVLLADAGDGGNRKASFAFTGSDGEVRTRSISRDDRLRATGRYFASTAGMPKGALNGLDLTFDTNAGSDTTLHICKTNLGEQS
jgi:alginate biosynthesis protein AlgX